jgi:hypothetical protein
MPDRTHVDRVYQGQREARGSLPHTSRAMEIPVSVPVAGQTGLRILLTQWQQADRVVLDGAQ